MLSHVKLIGKLKRIPLLLCDPEICAFWPKKAILKVYVDFIYAWLYMGCSYLIIDIFIIVQF